MPAVTIVAAWIKAETGVGPAIASGSHVYKGIWADLPMAPTNNRSVIATTSVPLTSSPGAKFSIACISSVPKLKSRKKKIL